MSSKVEVYVNNEGMGIQQVEIGSSEGKGKEKVKISKERRIPDRFGCKQFVPKGGWDGHNLLVEPESHLSRRARTDQDVGKKLKCYGNVTDVLSLYDKLELEVRELISETAFADFLIAIRDCEQSNRVIIRGLGERFWDTTNTFHLPWGEMTVTPYDFAVLSGLSFKGSSLIFEENLHKNEARLEAMFGPAAQKFNSSSVLQSTLAQILKNPPPGTTPLHKARLFLFYLLSSTIFADFGSRAHFHYAVALEDLRATCKYNWGAAAYSTFILYLRALSRSMNEIPAIAGFWRVLEVWFYEYFPSLAPSLKDQDKRTFPVMARWNSKERSKRKVATLEELRKELNESQFSDVKWNPWKGLDLPDRIMGSRSWDSSRVIFEGPAGWTWYLGERVSRQSLLYIWGFAVPKDPPPSMFNIGALSETELTRCKDPSPASEFLADDTDYADFKKRLMGPFITIGTSRPMLPDYKASVVGPFGSREVIEIQPVPDEEIEGWPLPEGCPGLDREEAKEVLKWGSTWKKAYIAMRDAALCGRSPLHHSQLKQVGRTKKRKLTENDPGDTEK